MIPNNYYNPCPFCGHCESGPSQMQLQQMASQRQKSNEFLILIEQRLAALEATVKKHGDMYDCWTAKTVGE